jgi:hypothetical protein
MTESCQVSSILQANNHGSLQLLCEYYHLHFPSGGSTLRFQPLEHLHPLEYHRPDGAVLHINGSTTDLRSCSASLELGEVDTIIERWLCEMRQCLLSIVTSHVVEFSNFNYQLYLFLDYFMWLLFILIRHTMHSWQRRKQLHYQPGPLHVYADPCDLSM